MSPNSPYPRTRSDRSRPVEPVSLATLVAFPLLLVALLVVASYPLASLAVLTVTAVGTKLAQRALAAVVARTARSPRTVTVPGVGTVTIQVSPT